MQKARYAATSFLGAFLLFSGLSLEADAGEPPKRIRLAGIFKISDGTTTSRALAIENSIISRLLGLELAAEVTPTYAELCKEASCLPQVADKAGADFAVTGTVYRVDDLCTVNLWIYDRRSTQVYSPEIRCQPGASDESLAGEFADQVGRLIERAQTEVVAAPLSPPLPALVAVQQTYEAGWSWDLKRKTTIPVLVATTAGCLGAAIMASIFAGASYETKNEMNWEVQTDSARGVVKASVALWSIASVSALALAVTTKLLRKKR